MCVAAVRDDVRQQPDVQRLVGRFHAQHPQQRARRLVGVDAGFLEQLVDGHVENARGVVGAFDVAADPVQRFGVAGQCRRGRARAP